MNPYAPPPPPTPDASVSHVAIGILSAGTIGLGSLAAVLCGFSCYHALAGNTDDDLVAIVLLFGVPLCLFACIGIPAGLIHLRKKSKLEQIPTAVYVVTIAALIGASLLGNPISRWGSFFLIACLTSIVASIRTAIRYQRSMSG